MKKHGMTILLFLILVIGLSLLLYPTFSDYWNSRVQSKVIVDYNQQISDIDEDKYEELWEDALEYNASLLSRTNPYILTEEQTAQYDSLLDVAGTGVMAFISIPNIDVELPIYHSTREEVLQVAVGHIEWSSLPVGGESSHCVVSGHRGLPSAKLFTDIDELEIGDVFMLHTMGETLTYQVDQILIVEPHDTKALMIEEGKDLCTLVTCTPYGVNTHRLLVRGHRVETPEEVRVLRVTADAVLIEPQIVAPVVAAPILILLFLGVLIVPKRRSRK